MHDEIQLDHVGHAIRDKLYGHATGAMMIRWSRCAWEWLHAVTFLHGDSLDTVRMRRVTALLPRVLPCPRHVVGFSEYTRSHALDVTGADPDWRVWYVDAHNAINAHQSRGRMDYAEVASKYAEQRREGTLEIQCGTMLWDLVWTIGATQCSTPERQRVAFEFLSAALWLTYPAAAAYRALAATLDTLPHDAGVPTFGRLYDTCLRHCGPRPELHLAWMTRLYRYNTPSNVCLFHSLVATTDVQKWALFEDVVGDTFRDLAADQLSIHPSVYTFLSRTRFHHKLRMLEHLRSFRLWRATALGQ